MYLPNVSSTSTFLFLKIISNLSLNQDDMSVSCMHTYMHAFMHTVAAVCCFNGTAALLDPFLTPESNPHSCLPACTFFCFVNFFLASKFLPVQTTAVTTTTTTTTKVCKNLYQIASSQSANQLASQPASQAKELASSIIRRKL